MSEFSIVSYKEHADSKIRQWCMELETKHFTPYNKKIKEEQIVKRAEDLPKWFCPIFDIQFTTGRRFQQHINSNEYKEKIGLISKVNCPYCFKEEYDNTLDAHIQKKASCRKAYEKKNEWKIKMKQINREKELYRLYCENKNDSSKWTKELILEYNQFILKNHSRTDYKPNDIGLLTYIEPEPIIVDSYTIPQQEDDYLSPEEENNKFIMESASYKLALEAQERYEAEQKRILDWESKNKLVEI